MSKNYSLLIGFFISFISLATGQDTNYVYFDENWMDIAPKKAKFILRQTKQPKGYLEELSTAKGVKIYSIECSSLKPYIENGESLCWDDEGNMLERGYFKNGHPDSLWVRYYPNSNITDTISYLNLDKVLESSKKPQSEKAFVVVEEMPTFPNNDDPNLKEVMLTFKDYLDSKMYYPEIAKRRRIRESVMVSFIVDPEGDVCNINFMKPPRFKLAEYESLRLMQDLPKWNPGKQSGKNVAVKFAVSITFFP